MTNADVRIYTTPSCGYCYRAIELLRGLGVAFEQHDVSMKPDMRKWLFQATGRTTVPQIFIDDLAIGGYDDLAMLKRSGQLQRMLRSKGAP